MFKRFATSLFLLFLISLNFLTQINLAQTGCKSCLNSKTNKVNTPADVTSLELSDVDLSLPCPPGTKKRAGSCSDDSRVISVHVTAGDPEDDPLTYNYTVSGGRIIKIDKNTAGWDLSGVRPGTYTITAGVDDGCGFCGKTVTKTVIIRDCDSCYHGDPCPNFEVVVIGSSGLIAIGGSMNFTAQIVGDSPSNLTYSWTVSSGTITSGQGTSVITVATTKEMAGQTVTATVSISGGFMIECRQPEGSGSSSINEAPKYGNLSGRVLRASPGNSNRGIPQVQVELIRDGKVIDTVTTDKLGWYQFNQVVAVETYTIRAGKNKQTKIITIDSKIDETVMAPVIRLKTR